MLEIRMKLRISNNIFLYTIRVFSYTLLTPKPITTEEQTTTSITTESTTIRATTKAPTIPPFTTPDYKVYVSFITENLYLTQTLVCSRYCPSQNSEWETALIKVDNLGAEILISDYLCRVI